MPEISNLPAAATLTGLERIPGDQNGVTTYITPTQLGNYFGTGGAIGGLSAKIYYLSKQSGVFDDADISEGSTSLGTNSTVGINNVFAIVGPKIIVWDVAARCDYVEYNGDTEVFCMPGCGAIQSNGANQSFLRPANVSMTSLETQNVRFHQMYVNGNQAGQTSGASATYGQHVLLGVFGVNDFVWNGGWLIDGISYAALIVRTENVIINYPVIDCRIDGIDCVGGNTNLEVNGAKITGEDDHCVMASEPLTNWDPVVGSYYNGAGGPCSGTWNDIVFNGGDFGLRTFDTVDPVNATFNNFRGWTRGYIVHARINYAVSAERSGTGAWSDLVFNNWDVKCYVTGVNDTDGDYHFSGNRNSVTFNDSKFYRDSTTMQRPIFAIGPSASNSNQEDANRLIREFNFSRCTFRCEEGNTSDMIFMQVFSGKVGVVNMTDCYLIRGEVMTAIPNGSYLVKVEANGTVPLMKFTNCTVDGGSVLHNSGVVDVIEGNGVNNLNSDSSAGSFINASSRAILDINLDGSCPTPTSGAFLKQRGPAFMAAQTPNNLSAIFPLQLSDMDFDLSANKVQATAGDYTPGPSATAGYTNIVVDRRHVPNGRVGYVHAVWHASAGGPAVGGTLMLTNTATPTAFLSITGFGIQCDMSGNLYAVKNGVTTLLEAVNGRHYWVGTNGKIYRTNSEELVTPTQLHDFLTELTGDVFAQLSVNSPGGHVVFPKYFRA